MDSFFKLLYHCVVQHLTEEADLVGTQWQGKLVQWMLAKDGSNAEGHLCDGGPD
jgi:hypothetical protein